MAVADLFGRSAGAIVKRVWKADGSKTGWERCIVWPLVAVEMDEMAEEVDVRVKACVISCLSLV